MTHGSIGPAADQLVILAQHNLIAPEFPEVNARPERDGKADESDGESEDSQPGSGRQHGSSQDPDGGLIPEQERERDTQNEEPQYPIEPELAAARGGPRRNPIEAQAAPQQRKDDEYWRRDFVPSKEQNRKCHTQEGKPETSLGVLGPRASGSSSRVRADPICAEGQPAIANNMEESFPHHCARNHCTGTAPADLGGS